jgi:hypothetical protein
MSTLAYPSPTFPGPPSVTLEVGDDWEPVHAPGTMLAGRLPRADDDLVRSVLTTVRVQPWTPADPTTQEPDA